MMSSESNVQGVIIKGVGGFYYVQTREKLIECRARGLFRKQGIAPVAGDIAVVSSENDGGFIMELLPRKNILVRPPVANLDCLVIVSSVAEPVPNLLVNDKLIAVAELKSIEPLLVFTKDDLESAEKYAAVYRQAGFAAYCVSSVTGEGVDEVRRALQGKLAAFAGNSGVGKSSLLNRIDPRLGLATGEISHKLGRGRHTTRKVELFAQPGGGYIADTPGFSSMDIERFELVYKEDLEHCFREFAPFLGRCRFTGCSHRGEKGCAVTAAVERGELPLSRYQSYLAMYEEVKDVKPWEHKQDGAASSSRQEK